MQTQHSERLTPQAKARLSDELGELQRTALRRAIAGVVVAYVPLHIFISSTWAARYAASAWSVALWLGLSAGAAFALMRRSLQWAAGVWLAGLAASITVAVERARVPEAAFAFVLLPFFASCCLRRGAELMVAAGVAALALIQVRAGWLPGQYALLVPLLGAMMALWGRAFVAHYHASVYWSTVYVAQTQAIVGEVRAGRARLRQLVKDLDQAYAATQRAHSARLSALQAAEEARRFKTEFVNNVSHELRTPLNLIIGFLDVMITAPENYGGELPGAYRRDLTAVYNSAQHLRDLIDDVLDLARIDAQKFALSRQKVTISALVQEVLNMTARYVAAKGITLQAEVDPALPDLWIDRLRIRQVLLNLISNSIRFTEQGWIRITVTQQPDEMLVRVQDTGRGIAPDEIDKLFKEFRTSATLTDRWHSGSGLGLAISKKFVELHGGQMGIDQSYTGGACVWFTLPLPGAVRPAGDLGDSRQDRWTAPAAEARGLVVVIHENERVVQVMKRYLPDFEVVAATSPEEGVALAERLHADVIITGSPAPLPLSATPRLTIRCPLPARHRPTLTLDVEDILTKPISRHDLLAILDRLACVPERVLVLDDDPAVGQLLRRILRMRVPAGGFIDAFTGGEGLALMRSEKPDLVLLDLSLPDLNGFEVLDHMAQDPALADIPVIIVSGYEHGLEDTALQGDVVISPPDPLQLGAIVRVVESVLSAALPPDAPDAQTGYLR